MDEASRDPKVLSAALRASQTLDVGEFAERCAEGIGGLLAAESVHTYLRVPGSSDLELRASWPDRRRHIHRPPARLAGSFVGMAGPSGRLIDLRKLKPAGNARLARQGEEVLLLPLGEGDLGLGLVLAMPPGGRTGFTAGDLGPPRAFVRLLTPALENLRVVSDLRETAVRDDIAGCYNRRHFEIFMEEEIARAKRFRSQVAILFLDMDDLKSVNTRFGHAMGSRSLQEVANRILQGIRKIDKLFRFGGDEFCIVLPETDAQGAFEVGERTRQGIAAAPFLVAAVGGVALSASLGAATFPDHGETAEALVQAADRAMQSVKKAGKNATGLAESPTRTGSRRGGGSRPKAEGG